ncbi:MAG: hypothetical protein EBS01_07045, partial [Verrucomicrobia bacterium]|nr:hypothetical protein [Verrucomicrobiota bacterium]
DTVDISAAGTLSAGTMASAYALRTSSNISLAASATGTLTLTNGGLIITGGTIGAIASNVPDALTINFGANGGAEAVIYATGSPFINASIKAAGLTKFGSGNLALTGVNTLSAPVTLNGGGLYLQNTLDGTTGNALSTSPVGGRAIILNGGQLNVDTGLGSTSLSILPDIGFRRALATLNSDIFLNADASIYGATTTNANVGAIPTNNISLQPLKSLTFADLGAVGGPVGESMRNGVTLTLNAVYVNGTTALGDHSNNIYTVTGQSYGSVLGGSVTGGLLNKYGPAILLLASGSNSYSKGSVVYGDASGTNTNSSVLGSLTRTGTPFGTGSITVNPGALLRLADLSNITSSGSNAVTVLTDGQGLGGIGLGGNFAPPSFTVVNGTSATTASPGQIVFKTSGDYTGVLALDTGNYSQYLNMASIGGGKMWLGSSLVGPSNGYTSGGVYFNPLLGAGSADTSVTAPLVTANTATTPVYRLGGGGGQGYLWIGGGISNTTGVYENVLTGTANVMIGAVTTPNAAAGLSYVNGNSQAVQLTNRNNLSSSSMVFLNLGSNLMNLNAFSLGDATLVFNGGSNQPSAPISNSVSVLSDSFSINSYGSSSAVFRGPINLSPSGIGGTRTVNTAGSYDTYFSGVVSGSLGANLIKSGAYGLALLGTNTYLGTTTVSQGSLFIGASVQPNQAGPLGISDTPVLLTGGNFVLAGQVTMGRDMFYTSSGTLQGQSVYNSAVTGAINLLNSGVTMTVYNASSVASPYLVGGVIDLQGAITGGGSVQIGNTGTAPVGLVRLSGNVNGIGMSTFSGGAVLRQARIQIATDTLYTGSALAPTILSGPFGTGAINLNPGTAGDVLFLEAYGADRVVVNPIASGSITSSGTLGFGGHNNLTLTAAIDINKSGGSTTRTFLVNTTQGGVTFSGTLSNTNTTTFTKSGAGLLTLSGSNTFATTATGTVSSGILQVASAGALGSMSKVSLGGGVLQLSAPGITYGGSQTFTLTASSGIDVASGTMFVLRQTAPYAISAATLYSGSATIVVSSTSNLAVGMPIVGNSIPAGATILSVGTNGMASGGTVVISAPATNNLTADPTVAAGSVLTSGAFPLTKTGGGTLMLSTAFSTGSLDTTFTNLIVGGAPLLSAAGQLSGQGGGFVLASGTTGSPFGSGSISLYGGVVGLVGGSVAQSLTVGSISFGAGSYIQLNGGTTSSTLTVGTLGRNNLGTLTLLSGSLVAGGSTEVLAVGGTTAYANTGSMLSTPNVYLRLAGSGQDADFVQLGSLAGTWGFKAQSASTTSSLTASSAGTLAVISSNTPVGTGTVTVLGMKVSNSTVSGGGTLVLTTGGLIFNGGTASTISAPLYFGTY